MILVKVFFYSDLVTIFEFRNRTKTGQKPGKKLGKQNKKNPKTKTLEM